ncbi:hypothetical protein ACIHDR_47745 [Nocardia sp. NPDC052278]|uniref:hypothetical protein n=1 Tax=unclassified Nocardia TaxID=2637762 RepID=UPI003687D7BC
MPVIGIEVVLAEVCECCSGITDVAAVGLGERSQRRQPVEVDIGVAGVAAGGEFAGGK